jgi:sulfate adenylyltransferase large subunit
MLPSQLLFAKVPIQIIIRVIGCYNWDSMAAAHPVDDFIAREQTKELLRFTTAGSVDDGKSTLIGRLLYDSKGVYEDQLAAVKSSSINRASGPIDFSLLTDGLKAEREQGITIDVAYRYFSTPKRKFIIADTPGHEQYTRNMATGASTAHLAIVLVDARKGVLPQSRRHAFIAALLGIPRIAVAVNKMDLVDYSRDVFEQVSAEFRRFAAAAGAPEPIFFPISALEGDNIVSSSARTPWYRGPSLLEHLETVPLAASVREEPMRFPVQYVIRPSLDFRGYAGQVASGRIRRGDVAMVLPSGRTSRVKSIVTFDGELESATAPQSVTVCLEDELDVSRGDMLVPPAAMPHVSRRFEATVVWMHADALEIDRPYLIKHTTQQVHASVTAVRHRVDINTLEAMGATQLHLNEIGVIAIETHKPLFFDAYQRNRTTGSFILIDPLTNATVAGGMIRERKREEERRRVALGDFEKSRLTPAERYARAGHYPGVVWLVGRLEAAYLAERMLFDRGFQVHVLADDVESHLLPEIARVSTGAGLITLCSVASEETEDRARARELVGAARFVEMAPEDLPASDHKAAEKICALLDERGLLSGAADGIAGEGI